MGRLLYEDEYLQFYLSSLAAKCSTGGRSAALGEGINPPEQRQYMSEDLAVAARRLIKSYGCESDVVAYLRTGFS